MTSNFKCLYCKDALTAVIRACQNGDIESPKDVIAKGPMFKVWLETIIKFINLFFYKERQILIYILKEPFNIFN